MNISSRTPEGRSTRCPVCGAASYIEPSSPLGDAPCPACGCLLWFSSCSVPIRSWDRRLMGHTPALCCVPTGPRVTSRSCWIRSYQLFAASTLAGASTILVAAALADAVWHARTVSEMVGWLGLSLLTVSLGCLIHSGSLDNGVLTQTAGGRATGDASRWCSAEPRQKRSAAHGASRKPGQSDELDLKDHPMRDRFLDG
jgi:hypothetical protein